MKLILVLGSILSISVALPSGSYDGIKGRRLYDSKFFDPPQHSTEIFRLDDNFPMENPYGPRATTIFDSMYEKNIPGLVPPSDQGYATVDRVKSDESDETSNSKESEERKNSGEDDSSEESKESRGDQASSSEEDFETSTFMVTDKTENPDSTEQQNKNVEDSSLSTDLQPPMYESAWESKKIVTEIPEDISSDGTKETSTKSNARKGVKGGFYRRRVTQS